MKLSIMREFVDLCETKNFSKTAEKLYIAQSALSRHIAALEKEMCVQLILRTKNTFQLTEAGEYVKKQFRIILKEYENTLYGISELAQKQSGELHLGVLYYDIKGYVAIIRETFHRLYPNVNLKLYSYQPQELEENLLNGKLDAGIMYGVTESKCNDISYMQFLKVPVLVMFSRNHRFSQKNAIYISDLSDEKILWPEEKMKICRTDRYIDRFLTERNVSLSKKVSLHNYDEVPFLLEDTGAIYIAPMNNPDAYEDAVQKRCIEPELLSEDISLVWLNRNQNNTLQCLRSAIKAAYS